MPGGCSTNRGDKPGGGSGLQFVAGDLGCVRDVVLRLSRNGFLLAAAITVVLVQALIPFVPALADAFRAQSRSRVEWGLVPVIALAPALLAHGVRAATHRIWIA
jgi:hypothetical protein